MCDEKAFRTKIEQAVVFAAERLKTAEGLTKPVLFHSLRVGFYLYENGYREEIVLAGFLHDLIEDTETTYEEIAERFGETVAHLVAANSKDDSLKDKMERRRKMVADCIAAGEDALIVKSADLLENYRYHGDLMKWQAGIEYLNEICRLVFESMPEDYNDPIIQELRMRYEEFQQSA